MRGGSPWHAVHTIKSVIALEFTRTPTRPPIVVSDFFSCYNSVQVLTNNSLPLRPKIWEMCYVTGLRKAPRGSAFLIPPSPSFIQRKEYLQRGPPHTPPPPTPAPPLCDCSDVGVSDQLFKVVMRSIKTSLDPGGEMCH